MEHNAGQIVRHFIAGKQLPQDNIVYRAEKHEDCVELQSCVQRLDVMDETVLRFFKVAPAFIFFSIA